jgi:hypothetical protein
MIWALLLITVATLGQMIGLWFAVPEHIVDPTWPLHARFHVMQAVFWITGLDGAILVLTWGPLLRQEQWSLWALLALLVFAQISYFVAALALPKGRPPSRGNAYDWILGAVVGIYAAGLVVAAISLHVL